MNTVNDQKKWPHGACLTLQMSTEASAPEEHEPNEVAHATCQGYGMVLDQDSKACLPAHHPEYQPCTDKANNVHTVQESPAPN